MQRGIVHIIPERHAIAGDEVDIGKLQNLYQRLGESLIIVTPKGVGIDKQKVRGSLI